MQRFYRILSVLAFVGLTLAFTWLPSPRVARRTSNDFSSLNAIERASYEADDSLRARGHVLRKLKDGDPQPFLTRLHDDRGLIDHPLITHDPNDYMWFDGATALRLFVERDDLPHARKLLELGASTAALDGRNRTPLSYACSTGMAELLLAHGAQLAPAKHRGAPAIVHAPNVELARFYLSRGADPRARDGDGLTGLHLASQRGDLELVKLLVERGADVNAGTTTLAWEPDWMVRTPLANAALAGRVEVTRYLLGHGADCGPLDGADDCPLKNAVMHGSTAITTLLLQHAAQLDPPRKPSTRVLIKAVLGSRGAQSIEIVRLLLDAGAPINGRYTPPKEVSFFAQFDPPREPDLAGWTPLHYAAYFGQVDHAKLLLARGADTTARTDAGLTPLACAERAEWPWKALWPRGDDLVVRGGDAAIEASRREVNEKRREIRELLRTHAERKAKAPSRP